MKKSQLKNSSLDHMCRRYFELQQLKSLQSPKVKNPLSFSNNVQYLPLTEFTSETISTRCIPTFFLPRSPFLSKYKTPLPPLNFSPHLLHTISHWAMIMMRKDVSADDPMQILHLYREVLSWNNLGELQKLLPPSVSTFDIRLMDSKFRNFPPLLFHPPQQNRLAKNPAEQHATIWTRTEQTRQILRSFVDVSANSRTAWGSRLRRWSVLWNNLKANTQLNKWTSFSPTSKAS